MIRRMAALALLVFLVTAVGCGKKMIPIEGTIKLGGKALADAVVTLTPVEGSKGVAPATGKSDSGGSFKLRAGKTDGVAVGDYTIGVSKSINLGAMKPGDPDYLKKMAELQKSGAIAAANAESKAIDIYNKTNAKITITDGTKVNIDIPEAK